MRNILKSIYVYYIIYQLPKPPCMYNLLLMDKDDLGFVEIGQPKLSEKCS